jgi:hypothetical protein
LTQARAELERAELERMEMAPAQLQVTERRELA